MQTVENAIGPTFDIAQRMISANAILDLKRVE
jgi:hypothetical protein